MRTDSGVFAWELPPGQPFLHFPRLRELQVNHGFVPRLPEALVDCERDAALQALLPHHTRILRGVLPSSAQLHTAQQVHGAEVAVAGGDAQMHPGVDALITDDPAVCLGIYTADCCAVFLWDSARRAAGLVHSGAKGTALCVVPRTIDAMKARFGCDPAGIVAVLSPCIRPPLYETDFAARIRLQCREAGVDEVLDGGECTGGDLGRYYSYRVEKGRTGRMLAFLTV